MKGKRISCTSQRLILQGERNEALVKQIRENLCNLWFLFLLSVVLYNYICEIPYSSWTRVVVAKEELQPIAIETDYLSWP